MGTKAYIAGLAVIITAGVACAAYPMETAGALAGILAVFLFTRRLDWFIFFIAVYTPFEEFILKWLPEALYSPARYAVEGLMIALFVMVLFRNITLKGRWWTPTPVDMPLLVLFCVIVLSLLYNDVPGFVAVLGVKNLFRYLLLFYIVVNADVPEEFWQRLVTALMIVVVIESLLGMLQYVGGDRAYEFFQASKVTVGGVDVREVTTGLKNRVFATMGRYNLYGNFLCNMMIVGLGLYYAGFRRNSPVYTVFFAISLVALLLSFSRMSWIGFYIGFVLILLILKQKRAIIFIMIPVIFTVALISAYRGITYQEGERPGSTVGARYASLFSESFIEKSMKGDRLFAVFVTAPAVFEKHALLGLGPGTFASEVTGGGTFSKGLFPKYSHANRLKISNREALKYTGDQGWVSIFCQVGALGLAAFVWLLGSVFVLAYRSFKWSESPFERGVSLGFMGMLGAIAFHNFASFNFLYRPVSLYLWLFAAMIFSMAAGRRVDGKDMAAGEPGQA